MKGIIASLAQLAEDEGSQTALDVAERWQNCLEDMLECATNESFSGPSQHECVRRLLGDVNIAILNNPIVVLSNQPR